MVATRGGIRSILCWLCGVENNRVPLNEKQNISMFKSKNKEPKIWGQNSDGTPYVVGITVAQLRTEMERYPDDMEVCMVVSTKKYWNGGGLMGKLKAVESGAAKQIWLKGLVIDESLE